MILSKVAVQEVLDKVQEIANSDKESIIFELEKLLPHGPIKTGVDMYKGYIIDQYSCPKCAKPIGDEISTFSYCPFCGQRIQK